MEIDGEVLTIDCNMSKEEVETFAEFIRPRFEYIETINVKEEGQIQTSALIALLVSLKKSNPELKIPFLEKGLYKSSKYGTMHWICHE